MSQRPWFKFFPADWRADPALRICSMAARGLWIELICLASESTPRGAVLVKGIHVPDSALAGLCGITAKEFSRLLSELESSGVFSRTAEGAIYSRRMVRDEEKLQRDRANGRTGGNPSLKAGVKLGVIPPDKGGGYPYWNIPSPTENLSVGTTAGDEEEAPFGRELAQ